MGLFSYFLNKNQATELEDTIVACWNKIQNYKKSNIEGDRMSHFGTLFFSGMRERSKLQEPDPIDYSNHGLDLSYNNNYKQYVLIASVGQFRTLNMQCSELAAKINEYSQLANKMGINISQNVSVVRKDLYRLVLELKYSYKYVVE